MIAFLQPLALLGLTAAAIPAILHLLTRRLPPTVAFPAVRYLRETEREQSRRLKLRHLLLLLLRTALIAFVVFAAARPVASVGVGASHPPTALGLIVDNSLSSGAVVDGRRVVERLAARARETVRQLTEQDHLWVVLADGVPRRLGRSEALAVLDSLAPSPRRLDLGGAVRALAAVVSRDPLPEREVVVLSDLQRSAWSAGETPNVRVLAWTPGLAVANRSIDSARAEPPVWSPRGAVVATVGGAAGGPAALRISLDDLELGRGVGAPGDRVVIDVRAARRGWSAARVSLDPDELRADDDWYLTVRVAEPVAATAEAGVGRYVQAGLAVLQEGGRATAGTELLLADRVGGGRVVVFPPADPARVGSVNRALAARGLSTQYGDPEDGEWEVRGEIGPADGMVVQRRLRLSGSGTVLARAGAEPWLVREGDLVLVASRMEEEWTSLPVSAAFIPFLDLLVNRIAAGEAQVVEASPGDVVTLPPGAEALLAPAGPVRVPGDRRLTAPLDPGVYFLRSAAGDTVGALAVNHDPRESQLEPVDARILRATLGSAAQLLSERALDRELFTGARRAELSGLFLLAALIAGALELTVASLGTRRAEATEG